MGGEAKSSVQKKRSLFFMIRLMFHLGFKSIWFKRLVHVCACTHAKTYPSLRSHDCSPPGSSVHGISQARKQEWVAISYSRGSSQPRNPILISCSYCIGKQILYHWAIGLWLITYNLDSYNFLAHIFSCYQIDFRNIIEPKDFWC